MPEACIDKPEQIELDSLCQELRYQNQIEKPMARVKEGKVPAKDPLLLTMQELRAGLDTDKDSAPHYELQAVRELAEYKPGSSQLISRLWPSLTLSCDGKVLDESVALNLSGTRLRLIVRADVTACQDIRLGPAENASSEGSYSEEDSFTTWTLVRK